MGGRDGEDRDAVDGVAWGVGRLGMYVVAGNIWEENFETFLCPLPCCATVPVEFFIKTTHHLAEAFDDCRVNPSHCWKLHDHKFPILARLKREFLAIPATSIPSEQLFSGARNLITNKGNWMLDTLCTDLLPVKNFLGESKIDV